MINPATPNKREKLPPEVQDEKVRYPERMDTAGDISK
jgi:hypothetical protein